MERGEYERLAMVEEHGWWFRGLHANLLAAWRQAAPALPRPALLDAGCGTGGLLTQLAQALPQARRFGLDLDPLAGIIARQKSGAQIAVGSIMALPFADQSLDAVLSADVLCHRGVEPELALASIGKCLKPGGLVILNLPAYRWLFSGHDRAVDNVRRFSQREIRALLEEAGFAAIRLSYWNSVLFPLMVLRRFTHPSGASDVALLPAPLEALFHAMVRLETWLGDRGWRFPFGGSILAVAIKP